MSRASKLRNFFKQRQRFGANQRKGKSNEKRLRVKQAFTGDAEPTAKHRRESKYRKSKQQQQHAQAAAKHGTGVKNKPRVHGSHVFLRDQYRGRLPRVLLRV